MTYCTEGCDDPRAFERLRGTVHSLPQTKPLTREVRVSAFRDFLDGRVHLHIRPEYFRVDGVRVLHAYSGRDVGLIGPRFACGKPVFYGDKADETPTPASGSEPVCKGCAQAVRVGVKLERIVEVTG